MYVALSLLVATIGAILKWAVADSVDGVALGEIGTILLVVGIIGFVLSLVAEMFARHRTSERIIEQPGMPAARERVREQL